MTGGKGLVCDPAPRVECKDHEGYDSDGWGREQCDDFEALWVAELHTPGEGERWRTSAHAFAEVALVKLAEGASLDEMVQAALADDDSVDIFGRSALAASAFAYMHRRFGPPPDGFDGDKVLGRWRLTTPRSDTTVTIYPCADSVGVGVGARGRYIVDPTPEIVEAVIATLADLMRPVPVRDSMINAAGVVDGTVLSAVNPFRWAGYGVTADYWARFEEKGDE
ncbi:MAG: hypothetical protein Q8Q14_04695 [Gemmatimonadales bacterium]|nr:hypothetical protein [Gemmatimonadales bacterium]